MRSSRPGLASVAAALLIAGASVAPAQVPDDKEHVNSIGLKLVRIEPGRFVMGAGAAAPRTRAEWLTRDHDEAPAHTVVISRAYYLGAYEVTHAQFEQFAPEHKKLRGVGNASAGDDDPVVHVTWAEAAAFCDWLARKEGRPYRLPTEAEWEYACRAGTTTTFSTGDSLLPEQANFGVGVDGKARPAAVRVGSYKPNPWGLFDMHGNVAEWVLDAHDKGFYATLGGHAVNPVRWPSEPYPHVVRGGSWDDDPEKLRSAARRGSHKGWKIQDPQIPKSIWYLTDARFVGFRVVRPLHPPPPEEWARYFEPDVESIREVLEKQRAGGR
jgi:formylglycine-generating enzyme required for sulfatase activity